MGLRVHRSPKAEPEAPSKESQPPYYNFIRENQGLANKTPAEMAGLFEAGEQNRWMALMKKAMQSE